MARSGGYGTCEALEKEYLRLTSMPRAADVRPPNILALALKMVKAKWLQKQDYPAACEQLRSIRQASTARALRPLEGVRVCVWGGSSRQVTPALFWGKAGGPMGGGSRPGQA